MAYGAGFGFWGDVKLGGDFWWGRMIFEGHSEYDGPDLSGCLAGARIVAILGWVGDFWT